MSDRPDFLKAYGSIIEEASSRIFPLYDGGIRQQPADVIGAHGQDGVVISAKLGGDPSFVDVADRFEIRFAEC